jgi:hypothetical protein
MEAGRTQVIYEGSFETGNPQRFGQDFAQLVRPSHACLVNEYARTTSQVANPKDIISFTRRKKSEARAPLRVDLALHR